MFYNWYSRTYWPDCLRWIIFREQQDPFYVLHLPKTSPNVPGILQLVQNWNETNNLRLIFLIRFKGVYKQLPNIYDAVFCKNSKRFLEAVNNFSKKAPSGRCSDISECFSVFCNNFNWMPQNIDIKSILAWNKSEAATGGVLWN